MNRDGLLPYQKRRIDIPTTPKGLTYKNMGTMENHIWSIIARRMKHNHTSWSIKGDILHAAKVKERVGRGYAYPVTGHVVELDAGTRGERRRLISMAGF